VVDAVARPIRILLADDHEVVRLGLKTLLARYPDLDVVAEAASGEEAIRQAEETKPDVAVLDVRMPGGGGIEACRQIRSNDENIKVLMLTSYADREALESSILAGAAGYVLKEIGADELVNNIRKAYNGESILAPAQIAEAIRGIRQRVDSFSRESELTEQEDRILSLLAEGKTNRQIAEEIYLSEKTVRNYVSNILGKLGLSNRAEAAAYAVRRNFRAKWDI